MRRLIIILLIVVVVIAAGMFGLAALLSKQDNSSPAPEQRSTTETLLNKDQDRACGLPAAESVAAQERVAINGGSFDQPTVTIKVGQTVRWANTDSGSHQIASDPYPVNDACNGFESSVLTNGQDFGFTFTKPGTWGYHDQLNPAIKGQVVVTE